jgi:hypothetical protein
MDVLNHTAIAGMDRAVGHMDAMDHTAIPREIQQLKGQRKVLKQHVSNY